MKPPITAESDYGEVRIVSDCKSDHTSDLGSEPIRNFKSHAVVEKYLTLYFQKLTIQFLADMGISLPKNLRYWAIQFPITGLEWNWAGGRTRASWVSETALLVAETVLATTIGALPSDAVA